jgi:hypothetical protein
LSEKDILLADDLFSGKITRESMNDDGSGKHTYFQADKGVYNIIREEFSER